jgi:hypothetical protein
MSHKFDGSKEERNTILLFGLVCIVGAIIGAMIIRIL